MIENKDKPKFHRYFDTQEIGQNKAVLMATISINFAYKLQGFWHEWNIRILVLLSQFLQVLLYFALPYRRCISNSFILFLINGTYEVSFAVAGMALACISSGMPNQKGYQPPLVLWASFMLLHLSGGGYTTAHTLDDYEKWYKRFFNFFFHDLVMFFVIWFQWRQVSVPGSWAFILALAYFFGVTQMKRRRSRIGNLRELRSPLENAGGEEETNESGTVDEASKALKYYQSTKKVIRVIRLTTTERKLIRQDFLKHEHEAAVRIVERELCFAFTAYFTSGVDPPTGRRYLERGMVVNLFLHAGVVGMLIALGIKISFLSSSTLEHKYKGTDTLITRILCFCTVFPYFMGLLLKLCWYYATVGGDSKRPTTLGGVRSSMDAASHDERRTIKNRRRNKSFVRSRLRSSLSHTILPWSRTISRRSFMSECLLKAAMPSDSFIEIFLRWCMAPSTPGSQSYEDAVGRFIFGNLKKKAEKQSEAEDDSHRVIETKDDEFTRVLLDQLAPHRELLDDWFLHWPYDMRLLRWHIATEILYYTNNNQRGNDPNEFRLMSNLLSQYLMHLTFELGHIMSRFQGDFIFSYPLAIEYIQDKAEFEKWKWYRWCRPLLKDHLERPTLDEQLKGVYEMITQDAPVTNQRTKEKEKEKKAISQPPVVRDAVKIAQALKDSLKENEMWEVISEVWVHMLVYAALHSDPMAHVEKLAEGGELITIVWLLSVHLGFGDFFLPKEETEKPEDA